MRPKNIDLLRVESDRIGSAFIEWLNSRSKSLPRFVAIEGLPCSGKTTLLKLLPKDTFFTIELDCFINAPAGPDHAWRDCIPIDKVLEAIRIAQGEYCSVAIEGPALWDLSQHLFNGVSEEDIVRVYTNVSHGRLC
ncbi:MAG: hypothetical protein RLO80_05295 [Hyphomonas sp.]